MIKYLLREVKNNFKREQLANISSIWALAISILIMGIFFLIATNLNKVMESLKEKVEIIVFLDDKLTVEEISSLRKQIFDMGNIEDITYTSKEEALNEFSTDSDMAYYIKIMGENPLPASFNVKLINKNITRVSELAEKIKFFQGITEVRYGQEEVRNLGKIIFFIRVIGLALGSILGLVSLSMIIYTIRLAVSLRREEIKIMQLVGATAGFIRAPFLVEGLFAGLLGCVCGLSLLGAIYYLLALKFNGIVFLPVQVIIGLFLGGVLLGFIGSFISTQKYIEI